MKTEIRKIGNTYSSIETQRTHLNDAKERLTQDILEEIKGLSVEVGSYGVNIIIDSMYNYIINEIEMHKESSIKPTLNSLNDIASTIYAIGNIAKRLNNILTSFNYLECNRQKLEYTDMNLLI